jgi:hypothetical protein
VQRNFLDGLRPSAAVSPKLQRCLYCLYRLSINVDDSEVPALLAELKGLLAEHSEFVRYLAAKTLNRAYKESSPSKAAD